MKITYKENPLATTVELDNYEREIFWHKVKWETVCDEHLFSAHFSLTHEPKDIERAIRHLDPSYYLTDGKSELDERVDHLTAWYIDELISIHDGDCTCMACTCSKCHAESILGINTLAPYPGKYVNSKIQSAFSYKENDEWKQRSLKDALEILRNYESTVKQKPEVWKNFSQEEYEKYIPRWVEEGKQAYNYLLNYAKEHNML